MCPLLAGACLGIIPSVKQLKKLGMINMEERKAQIPEGLPVFQRWAGGSFVGLSLKAILEFYLQGNPMLNQAASWESGAPWRMKWVLEKT